MESILIEKQSNLIVSNVIKSKRLKTPKKCKKWMLLKNIDIRKEYEIGIVTCKKCRRYSFPYFVHCDMGDYLCYKCGNSGSLKTYCVYCKHNIENL